MRFHHVEPDEHFFLRFASESGLWHLGLYRTAYGVRVQLEQGWCISFDYCCGMDLLFATQVLFATARILGCLPEGIRQGILERQFPRNTLKPMPSRDGCWEQLQAMAEKATPWDNNLGLPIADCMTLARRSPKYFDPFAHFQFDDWQLEGTAPEVAHVE